MLSKTVIPSQRYRHFLAGCALAFCSGLHAEVQEVTGEFFYGPGTSEKQACEAAEQRAKQEALRLVLGECHLSWAYVQVLASKEVTKNGLFRILT